MKYVTICKIKTTSDPKFPAADPDDFEYGQNNHGVSLPVEYTITGGLIGEVKIGSSVRVARDSRNGVFMSGLFVTSRVVNIRPNSNGMTFNTENSVYQLKWTEEPSKTF